MLCFIISIRYKICHREEKIKTRDHILKLKEWTLILERIVFENTIINLCLYHGHCEYCLLIGWQLK